MPESLAAVLRHTGKQIDTMELASKDFFSALRRCSVVELKALQPNTPRYKDLIETLIVVRELMG